MNGKDKIVDYLANDVLHENSTLTSFDKYDNGITHTVAPTSKRNLLSSSGERKPAKHLISQSHDAAEEANNLVGRGNPRDSPRFSELNNTYSSDVTASTYALQIALKSMKERYQKLQKKIAVLEEENGRLISGKSELFSEIGKMQESSIKLREKNLQLNHEVHSKHQECCSLKEQFSSVSKENLKLTSELSHSSNESRKLTREVDELSKQNEVLKNSLDEILSHCRRFSVHPDLLNHIERIVNKSLNRNQGSLWAKTRIIPRADDFEQLDDLNTITGADFISSDPFDWDASKDSESLSVEACVKAKELMKKIRDSLQKQNQQLSDLKPYVVKVSKRKLDSSDVEDSGDQGRNYLSRFASCGSAPNPSGMELSSEEQAMCATVDDSGGETNVLVEEIEERERKIPFDWRKVEVSDDEATEGHRPETRTVSTSPDLTITFDPEIGPGSRELSSDDDRTCPMCNAIFPLILPQETFESHVVSHFEVENGFEVIT